MLSCTGVRGVGPEHPAQLLDDFCAFELGDGRAGEVIGTRLLDAEVSLGERRDLRQVRDAEHLTAAPERAQLLAHGASGVTANAGVDLVEHERARAATGRDA